MIYPLSEENMRYLSCLLLVSCIDLDVEDSCSEYVDYMCECHSDDPDFDCTELQNLYENAGSEKQSECALALDDQIYSDSGAELTCDPSDTAVSGL